MSTDLTKPEPSGGALAVPGHPTPEELIAGGKVMSLWDHLSELRSRIMRSLWGVMAVFMICFAFADTLIKILKVPLIDALPKGANALHFTGPLDVFMVQLKVAGLVGIVASCPIWLYQFWKFFEPALYPRERRYILPFIVVSTFFFFGGAAFCYFVVLPFTLKYLINMGMQVGTPLITIKDYVSLLLMMLGSFGAIFEVPVIIVLLAMLDIITLESLTAFRRYVVVVVLVVSALLVPPDPISQVAMAVPLYGMYEVAIIVVRFIKRAQAKAGPRGPGDTRPA